MKPGMLRGVTLGLLVAGAVPAYPALRAEAMPVVWIERLKPGARVTPGSTVTIRTRGKVGMVTLFANRRPIYFANVPPYTLALPDRGLRPAGQSESRVVLQAAAYRGRRAYWGEMIPVFLGPPGGAVFCPARPDDRPRQTLDFTGLRRGGVLSEPVVLELLVEGAVDRVVFTVDGAVVSERKQAPFSWTLVPASWLGGRERKPVLLAATSYWRGEPLMQVKVPVVLSQRTRSP